MTFTNLSCIQENEKTDDRGHVPQKHKHIAPVQLFQNTSDSQFIKVENIAWKKLKNKTAK